MSKQSYSGVDSTSSPLTRSALSPSDPVKAEEATVTMARGTGYRPDVDGLRAIAVLAVVVYHFSHSLLPRGFLGVDIFFVISGYVVSRSLCHHPHKCFRDLFLAFYSRRVKRLLPALVLCVLPTCLIGSFFISPVEAEYASSLKAGFLSLLGVSNIYFYWQSLDYFGASAILNLFTHTWSLGVEEQFYLVLPALFWITGNTDKAKGRSHLFMTIAVLSILSFASYAWFDPGSKGVYYMISSRFWELGVGCMIGVRPQNGLAASTMLRYVPWFACAGIAAALIVPDVGEIYATIAVVISTAGLIYTLHPEQPVFRFLTLHPLLTIGVMSYSLYLWHWPVLTISRWTVGIDWWSSPFQLAAIFALAGLSYRFVERPLRTARWAPSNLLTIGIGLGASACSGAVIIALTHGVFGRLYTGEPIARLEAKGVETLMDEKWYQGQLVWTPQKCILSSDSQVGKQITRDICTLNPAPSAGDRRFVVIGNSFSAAEFEMYSVLNEMKLGTVVATSSWGASPVQEIPNHGQWSKANNYYWSTVVPALIAPLHRGDVLIMINDLSGFAPSTQDPKVAARLALFKAGLDNLSKNMAAREVQIVFQTQNPLLRDANCSPDMAQLQWFNIRGNLRCRFYSKAETRHRLGPLRQMLDEVQNRNKNFHILDLFSVMCPGDLCTFQNDKGVFLYRDIWSHPSIEANRLSRPLLLSVIREATSIGDVSLRK